MEDDLFDNKAIRDVTGLIACLSRSDLENFGVNSQLFPDLASIQDEECIIPGKYIPEAFTEFDFQQMRFNVSIPQAAMHKKPQGSISPEYWDDGINAALLNYVFNGNANNGDSGNSRRYYLNLNSGINLGAWRLRDYRTWNYYKSSFYTASQWQRLKSYIGRNFVSLRSTLVIGDSNTEANVFDSLEFRGVQLASDEDMSPDSLRGFAPIIRGTANSNAHVNIRQNGISIYQTYVSAGVFSIDDLYAVSSSGNFEVEVTEADGDVRTFIVPYSTVPILQREGQLKYSLTAGHYNGGSEHYASPKFVQGTLVWGSPFNTTLYGGMQYSANYISGSFGTGFNLGGLGAFSTDITMANSQLADGSRHHGQSVRFLYSHALQSLGTTLPLVGYRYSTRGFHTLDETALKRWWGGIIAQSGGMIMAIQLVGSEQVLITCTTQKKPKFRQRFPSQ